MNGTVVDRWRDVVAARGDMVAVDGPSGPATFGQLDDESDAIAHAIASTAGAVRRPGDPILLLADTGATAIAALLGIWKAGGAVVVLDPSLPDAKLDALASASASNLCLATGTLHRRARQLGLASTLDLDTIGPPAGSVAAPCVGPETIGHIVFTSGSTGAPKGVCYPQRTLVHDAWTRSDVGWATPADVVIEPLPLAFAAGLHDTLGMLLAGAQVQLKDPRTGGISAYLHWLSASGATSLLATPNLLLAIASSLPEAGQLPQSLRMVRCTGEPFLSRDACRVIERLPRDCELINILGSSETGLLASYPVPHGISEASKPLPVGWPLPDKDIQLLAVDGDGADVSGRASRMVVRSEFTAVRYHRDPALSAEVFFAAAQPSADESITVVTSDLVRQSVDGCLHLLGRLDHTVKIRGYRVEPAEVQTVLLTCPQIRDAVVIGLAREGGGTRLVAYVCSYDKRDLRPAMVREWVRQRVASYLVPECVVQLDELPRNERGKLDRSRLPAPDHKTAFVALTNDWERVVAELWRDVLGVEEVGRDDDFFELGGDSLAAEELLAKLATEHRIKVDSRVIATSPTLGAFALEAVRHRDPGYQTLVPVRSEGSRAPLFCVAGGGAVGLAFLPLSRRLNAEQPLWGLQAHGLEKRWSIPDWSIRRLAARYLRELRTVQPQGPYYLAGHSFGGLVAFEMAHQLHAAGEAVALLVILDSFAPDPAVVSAAEPREPRTLRQHLIDFVTLVGTGIVPRPGMGHYGRFHRQSGVLSRRYRGTPWHGRTLVVTAKDENVPGRAHEWAPFLTGPWQLTSMAGDHQSFLREPHVVAVADAIEAALCRLRLD